jgi:hypothetical protein
MENFSNLNPNIQKKHDRFKTFCLNENKIYKEIYKRKQIAKENDGKENA